MRIVIVGGGIAAAYLANGIKEKSPQTEVVIVSKEEFRPYDRIHLCSLVDKSKDVEKICLDIDPSVTVELNQKIKLIDPQEKRVFSKNSSYSYDKLIISTGSKPKELFNIKNIENAATFRSEADCKKISENVEGKNVVIMGVGPIGLELLETLSKMGSAKSVTILSRGDHVYSKELCTDSINMMRKIFEEDSKVKISFNDTILEKTIENDKIIKLKTANMEIEDPFLVFGVGISPNVEFAKDSVDVNRGVVVDEFMLSSDKNIYAVGEAAELKSGYVAGRVKECTLQADACLSHLFDDEPIAFEEEVTIDGLKVGSFLLTDVTSTTYNPKCEGNENIVISSKKENRIDQYIVNDDKLVKFIGINTNVDPMMLKTMMEKEEVVDPSVFYSNRLLSERGRIVCSCASVYEQDLVDLIKENAIEDFPSLKDFSEGGRICGRCKEDIVDIIERTEVDPEEAKRIREEKARKKREEEEAKVKAKIEKFNALHPDKILDTSDLKKAIASYEMNKEYNKWISMVTANLRLHPNFEKEVEKGVEALIKIPIIWLELSDCTGNSEAFIKSANPTIDELVLNYISLDYHELLMSASGDQSEHALDEVLEKDKGKYILIVEGAVPMAMDGKYLRIGPKGETAIDLLRRSAKNAAAIISVGTCAYDGGVVAAEPNPTGAVGVEKALGRKDIINLPGCPTNPINVIGTLLHYIMFEELPKLDEKNRPLWAYGYRVHDNCERRGHYDLDEFVLEWGDAGAKKGWCLFKMGCKGPYADINCSLVKFNEGTSWPVQVGHGCFGCGEGKVAFDKYANNRELEEEAE
ncbi:MAG: hydrogenase small subunit [Campylobacterales bacterium]|nr:hydrogenase small subunit [Campylobacterales bacterium]